MLATHEVQVTNYASKETVALSRWYCYVTEALNSSGYFMYHTVVTICTAKFNVQKLYVLPTYCIDVFCVDLRTNGDFFNK
jgi:hypothetical protein